MKGTELTFKLLISTTQDMYEMWTLAKEAQVEQKKNGEIGFATINNKKCFNCRKPGHVQKDCKRKRKWK